MSAENAHPTLDLLEFRFWVGKSTIACIPDTGMPRRVYLPVDFDHLIMLCRETLDALEIIPPLSPTSLQGEAVDNQLYGYRIADEDIAIHIALSVAPDQHTTQLAIGLDQARPLNQCTLREQQLLCRFFNAIASQVSVRWIGQQAFTLSTSLDLFANWLQNYELSGVGFGLASGRRLILQLAQVRTMQPSASTITFDGIYLAPSVDGADIGMPVPGVITFRLIALAAERLEVRATCGQAAATRQFCTLLEQIALRWPEATIVIRAFDAPVSAWPAELNNATLPQPIGKGDDVKQADKKPKKRGRPKGKEPLDDWQTQVVEQWLAAKARRVRQIDWCNQNGHDDRELRRWVQKYNHERT